MLYYEINEETARRSHNMMSFSDYVTGSTTKDYQSQCDNAKKICDEVVEKCQTQAQKEHAYDLLEKYCKTLAYAINEDNRIGCQCPSVMISGAGNFPTRKKEKQVKAWESNRSNFEKAAHYLDLLSRVHCQGIQSNDPEAVKVLKKQLEDQKEFHAKMKRINAYHRKNKTLDGCPDLTESEAKKLQEEMDNWIYHVPYAPYELQLSNAKLKRIEQRIKDLETVKEAGNIEKEYEGFKYIENSEAMRIQFIFDGKPSEEVRDVLKFYGFRWAPSQGAWQRQLNRNGRYYAEAVIKKLKELD